jgi:hypothetical protein
MPIRLALYKGKSVASKTIRLLTRSEYSHVAFLLDSGFVVEAWTSGLRMVPSISSQHTKGTEVDIFEILGLMPEQEAKLTELVHADVQPAAAPAYDFWMVGQFVPVVRAVIGSKVRNQSKFFCSEYIVQRLADVGCCLFRRTWPYEVPPDWIPRSLKVNYLNTVVTK